MAAMVHRFHMPQSSRDQGPVTQPAQPYGCHNRGDTREGTARTTCAVSSFVDLPQHRSDRLPFQDA